MPAGTFIVAPAQKRLPSVVPLRFLGFALGMTAKVSADQERNCKDNLPLLKPCHDTGAQPAILWRASGLRA
jgi:hypothetical protein